MHRRCVTMIPQPGRFWWTGRNHNNVDAQAPAGTCHLVVCTLSQVGRFVRFDDMFTYRRSHAGDVQGCTVRVLSLRGALEPAQGLNSCSRLFWDARVLLGHWSKSPGLLVAPSLAEMAFLLLNCVICHFFLCNKGSLFTGSQQLGSARVPGRLDRVKIPCQTSPPCHTF